MKLSLSTGIFPGRLQLPQLEMLLQTGAKAVELVLSPRRLDLHNPSELEALAALLARYGAAVTTVHLPFGATLDLSVDATAENGIRETLAALWAAVLFRAPVAVIHASRMVTEADRKIRKKRSLDSLRRILEKSPATVRLALENLPPGYLCSEADELEEYRLALDDERVGFCLDTGHANMSGQLAALTDAAHGRHLLNLHVHDNDGAHDAHLPPGQGNVRWPELAARLRERSYAGPLTYEVLDVADGAVRQNFLNELYSGRDRWFDV